MRPVPILVSTAVIHLVTQHHKCVIVSGACVYLVDLRITDNSEKSVISCLVGSRSVGLGRPLPSVFNAEGFRPGHEPLWIHENLKRTSELPRPESTTEGSSGRRVICITNEIAACLVLFTCAVRTSTGCFPSTFNSCGQPLMNVMNLRPTMYFPILLR